MHYAVGDVHGCFTELKKLLKTIEQRDANAQFLFVGDFVDRGPEVWETLDWARSHISRTGRYRSVMGNHEAMLIDWYEEFRGWYAQRRDSCPAPLPMYDFLEQAILQKKDSPEALEPYIAFFKSLPLKITVRIPGKNKKRVTYDIVHAWIPPEDIPDPYGAAYYLWDRENAFAGNYENDHVIIHGHTPTHVEYRYLPESVPGMINYRKNAVNIDGGCVFAPHHKEYPCMLCALCLETLEEIYACTVEERMRSQMQEAEENEREAIAKEYQKRHDIYLHNEYRMEIQERLCQEQVIPGFC